MKCTIAEVKENTDGVTIVVCENNIRLTVVIDINQRCQQATFFQSGLAWSSLTQPGGRSVVDCLVSWPGLAWTRLQAEPGQLLFVTSRAY